MYLPENFKEADVGVLHDTIRQIKFGTLVTFGPGGLVASHVPMLIDAEPAPFGTLSGHVARDNPHWREASADTPALAIFLGPNTYVSPSAYATKRKTGKVVPTWNYVAVHAYGPVNFYDDADRLLKLVTRLTDTHETGRPNRWLRAADCAARRQMEDEPEPTGGGRARHRRCAVARKRYRGRGRPRRRRTEQGPAVARIKV